jgi:hypothetical protein
MCDGLEHNEPADFDTIVGNCLSHARRGFVDVIEQFPDECHRVLLDIREVYRVDAKAKKEGLSKDGRLRLHQTESGPIMNSLKGWCEAQFNDKKVEENSGLGKAINYMLSRWEKLTLFLRRAGAPIDNNVCERVIKLAILHRKNSYFYKTMRGAAVGDLFMSVLHSCQLNGVNPFDYLVAVLKHIDKAQEKPTEWLPWNYKDALAVVASGLTASKTSEEPADQHRGGVPTKDVELSTTTNEEHRSCAVWDNSELALASKDDFFNLSVDSRGHEAGPPRSTICGLDSSVTAESLNSPISPMMMRVEAQESHQESPANTS